MATLPRLGLVSAVALLLVVVADDAAEAQATSSPLEGVWTVVAVDPAGADPIDPAQPGLYIFAGDHYSAVYAPGPEPRIKSQTSFLPTAEEILAQYQSIIVNSGSYEVDGDSFTLRPMIAKSPGFVGGYLTGTFVLLGDTLTLRHEHLFDLDGVELPDFGEVLTLVRIE
jgi:hypothetical protein